MNQLALRRATTADVALVAPLFDAYRQFYAQPADREAAARFLAERLGNGESFVLIAEADGRPAGFAQLYPSYSSVRITRTLILNDLFVAPAARGAGVSRALLLAAEELARAEGASALILSTARDNTSAQALYRSAGWEEDRRFLTFTRALPQGEKRCH